jgi:hypothetical protein
MSWFCRAVLMTALMLTPLAGSAPALERTPLPPVPGLQPIPDGTVPPAPIPSSGVPFGRVDPDGNIILTPAEVQKLVYIQKKASASLRDAAADKRLQMEKDRIGAERADRLTRLLEKIK